MPDEVHSTSLRGGWPLIDPALIAFHTECDKIDLEEGKVLLHSAAAYGLPDASATTLVALEHRG